MLGHVFCVLVGRLGGASQGIGNAISVPPVSFHATRGRRQDFLFSPSAGLPAVCRAARVIGTPWIDDSGKHERVHAARGHADSEERGARACMTRAGIIHGARVE